MSTQIVSQALYVYALKENGMSYSDIIMQVKELLGRHLTTGEIARRLHMDINDVEQAMAILAKERLA